MIGVGGLAQEVDDGMQASDPCANRIQCATPSVRGRHHPGVQRTRRR